MRHVVIGLLTLYRMFISPIYGDVCRYYPSCSAFTLEAVRCHGAGRGLYLGVRRILRCHPWADGGIDPVPETFSWRREYVAPAECVDNDVRSH